MTSGRQALPGGAPVQKQSKRACKYGPRVDGLCPKRPSSSRGSSATRSLTGRSKPPCKYGPRGADGYCPKKSSTKRSTPASGSFLDKPISQGYTPAGNKRAPTTIRKEAIKVAESASKATIEHAVKQGVQAYQDDPEKFKAVAGEAAKFLGKIGLVGAIVTGIISFFAHGEKARDAEIKAQAQKMLDGVKAKVPKAQWKPEFDAPLLAQYEKWIRENLKILYRK